MRTSIAAIVGVASLFVSSQVALSHETHSPMSTGTAWGPPTPHGQIIGTAFQDGQAVYPRQRITPRGWLFEGNQQNDCCTRCGNGWDTFCDEKKAICGWRLRRHCGHCGCGKSACRCTATPDCGTCADDCGAVETDCGCGQPGCCKGRCGFGVFRLFGLLHHGSCGCSHAAPCGCGSAAECNCGAEAGAPLHNDVLPADDEPLTPPVPDDPSA